MHIEVRIIIGEKKKGRNSSPKKWESPFTKEKGLQYSQYQLTKEE